MAKTVGSAIVGKLIPAIMKAVGKRVVGVDMNKVNHIINKISHGFDKLSTVDIVYSVFELLAGHCPQTKIVRIVLLGGQVIHCVVIVTLSGGAVGLGTAYVIEKAAELIDKL